jgi:hypothetical protein
MTRGVNSKNSVENSNKQEKIENLQKSKPMPKVLMDPDHPNASEALD